MKSFQLLRRAFNPLQRTYTAPSHSHHQPSPLFNLAARTAHRKLLTFPIRIRQQRHPYSTKPKQNPNTPYNPTSHLQSPTSSLTLTQRLRKLSREYGWSAFGVYMLLSLLDFPFCFAAVRYLGTDRIGRYEHVVLEWVKGVIPDGVRDKWREMRRKVGQSFEEDRERGAATAGGVAGEEKRVEVSRVVEGNEEMGFVGYDHGVREAERDNESENASIWTQLALAYAIHKSFIFIRVPLTAAVTPKVVKTLRGWGWDIGKRRPKGAK